MFIFVYILFAMLTNYNNKTAATESSVERKPKLLSMARIDKHRK